MNIEKIFEAFEKESPSFQRDGVIDEKCYAAAPLKIMWVLKQDWVGAGLEQLKKEQAYLKHLGLT